ncbi:hypothetical protein Tco_0094200 [Tanacetum coccineum]
MTKTPTLLPPPPQPQQSTADPILVKRIDELEQHMTDLIQNNLVLEERLDKQGTRLYNLENLNIPYNRVEDFQLGIESYQTQLNLTKPGWDATGYEFKHDYTIIKSPRTVVFPVDNNDRKIMRFNEIYKFSDGTLTRILRSVGLQSQGIQGQAAQSGYEYAILDSKRRDKEQRVHSSY